MAMDLAREGVRVCGTDRRADLQAAAMGRIAADSGIETMNIPADADVDWLPADQVSKAILFCIKQDPDTIIPEIRIYHRAQI